MELSYVTLDVFTKTRFEGNPLAVILVPAASKRKLTQETKQTIAREFNFSESVFLHEPDPADRDDAPPPEQLEIDIFTTDQELPFAGHPTIGSAVLARFHLYPSVRTLHTKAGPIEILEDDDGVGGGGVRARIPHEVRVHRNTLADVLSVAGEDGYPGLSHHSAVVREAEMRAPVVSIVRGMTSLLVRLPSLEALGAVRTGRLDFAALSGRLLDGDWPTAGFIGRYYYVDGEDDALVLEGQAQAQGQVVRHVRTRLMELGMEDPATGSAASALVAYLTISGGAGVDLVVTQGVEMGRRSVIRVKTTAEVGGDGVVRVKELWLGGEAVVVMKGKITVE